MKTWSVTRAPLIRAAAWCLACRKCKSSSWQPRGRMPSKISLCFLPGTCTSSCCIPVSRKLWLKAALLGLFMPVGSRSEVLVTASFTFLSIRQEGPLQTKADCSRQETKNSISCGLSWSFPFVAKRGSERLWKSKGKSMDVTGCSYNLFCK